MHSRASLNVEKRKISYSSWNWQVIPLSIPGSAQPVDRGKHVARELRLMPSTNDIWMRNLVVTLGLAKPSQNVAAVLKTSNLFMESCIALLIQTVKMCSNSDTIAYVVYCTFLYTFVFWGRSVHFYCIWCIDKSKCHIIHIYNYA
jgi:hypothetical protein